MQDLREKVRDAKFISLSLNEVTVVDHTSSIFLHVYTFQESEHMRQSHLLEIQKMTQSCNAKNLCNLIVSCQKYIERMENYEIATKFTCVGVDGTFVMQWNKNGLCVNIQKTYAMYMIAIHCMAHIMNLSYKIVNNFEIVAKVKELVHDIHSYFIYSSKRIVQFKNFIEGLIYGKKNAY